MRSFVISKSLGFLLCGLVSLASAAAVLPAEDASLVGRHDTATLDRRAGTTDPTVGGWCTFHLTYILSDFLGRSGFTFWLYDIDGNTVAGAAPSDTQYYHWGSEWNDDTDWLIPPLQFQSSLPFNVSVIPHSDESVTWQYNEYVIQIPAPVDCTSSGQAPISGPSQTSIGCFTNDGNFKREVDPPVVVVHRRYEVSSQIDGGWTC